MRKLVLVVLFSLLSTAFFGQAAFDKFDGQDDVTSVIVNKKMFEMMGSVKMESKDKRPLEQIKYLGIKQGTIIHEII
jgi:hypothetical protein